MCCFRQGTKIGLAYIDFFSLDTSRFFPHRSKPLSSAWFRVLSTLTRLRPRISVDFVQKKIEHNPLTSLWLPTGSAVTCIPLCSCMPTFWTLNVCLEIQNENHGKVTPCPFFNFSHHVCSELHVFFNQRRRELTKKEIIVTHGPLIPDAMCLNLPLSSLVIDRHQTVLD